MTVKSILKWAGSKRASAATILDVLPEKIRRYCEPMIGGGAMFVAVAQANKGRPRYEAAIIGDTNEHLIRCYRGLRDGVENVIKALKKWDHNKETFERLREWGPTTGNSWENAARVIYLNRTCFNGLWRVNRAGKFNVPFGRYENPLICDADHLRAVSQLLQYAQIERQDFAARLDELDVGDAVYFDPPYVPISKTSNFTSYGPDSFGVQEHVRLAQSFYGLAKRGVAVALSNSDTDLVRTLYMDFNIRELQVRRSINSDGKKRGAVGELLITANCRGD